MSTMRTALRPGQTEAVLAAFLLCLLLQGPIVRALDSDALRTWCTMFVAVVVQAIPFLVFGVLLAAAISILVSERRLQRLVPGNAAVAVPVAGVAGVALPGCECASVPIAGSLVRRGVAPAAALTFLLAAPAVNPIVLVSTAVAFPGRPEIVAARFAASMLTAIVVGWLWLAFGGRVPLRTPPPVHDTGRRWLTYLQSVQHDFLHAAGYLVVGAMLAAAVNTFVPPSWLDAVADRLVLSVVVLGLFAFVVAMCSEADAFVAASLTAFSDTARLAFMVVGPAADVKLAAMQAGVFGRSFALVFAPLTVVVALASAGAVGWWLL